MKVFYSDEDLDLDLLTKSIFLAGPTPRDKNVPSWRPQALKILDELNYKGQVMVPERRVKQDHIDYIDQVEWENLGTEDCTRLVFWIPRDLVTMPAFTTNVEFGRYVESGKVMYGRPANSPKNRYLDWLYKKFNNKPIYEDLKELLRASIV
jgi:hypothetical protein